jgi:hypothetical protein
MLKDTTPTQQIKDRKANPNQFKPKFQPKNLIIQLALNKFNPLVYFYSATQPPVLKTIKAIHPKNTPKWPLKRPKPGC